MTRKSDIEFVGGGVWFVSGLTRKGSEFVRKHVDFEPWQLTTSGIAIDGSGMARAIADAALDRGLSVVVNGRIYNA